MKFIALVVAFCLVAAVSCEIDLKVSESGITSYKYTTDDAGKHSKEEKIEADGSITGSFSYIDANGDLRKTEYKAGPDGFQATGDIGVDKKTAEKAAKIAALAPKAPVEEKVDVKIPTSPFTLPFYAMPRIHGPIAAPFPLPYTALPSPLGIPLTHTHLQYW